MIWSRYNYLLKTKRNKYLLYNSMTNYFAEIEVDIYTKLQSLKKSSTIDSSFNIDSETIKVLQESDFIVENDVDFLNKLRLNSYIQRFNKESLNLTIAPTLKCNFNCPYCFEENRQNISMSNDTEDKLIEYIKSYKNIQHLNINWYGGEPLLAFDRIKSITKKLRSFSNSYILNEKSYENMKKIGVDKKILDSIYKNKTSFFKSEIDFWKFISSILSQEELVKYYPIINKECSIGIPFSATMISNGFLLTEDKIDDLIALNINKIQITFDGLEETHNRKRNVKKRNSFKVILKNIEKLFEKTNQIEIAFRINIDQENEDEYAELHNFLHKKFAGKNMFVYPGYIYSTHRETEGCKSAESCNLDRERKANFILSQFDKLSNHKNNLYYPSLKATSECMARSINAFLIDAKGNIYKCWDDIGIEERVIANLNKKGVDNINVKLLNKYLMQNDPYANSECLECFHLPICGGGCPYMRIHNEGIVDNCAIFKDRIDEFLEAHYEIKKKRIKK